MTITQYGAETVLHCPAEGPVLTGEQDALDLIGEAWGAQASAVVLPAGRLDPSFFVLSSGFAGAFVGKFVNYRMVLVVVGDISAHLERSEPLRAFRRETNQGKQFWLLDTADEVAAKFE
ncbi:DUF4180 domain-containing protein [Actinokineospora globicatena]|uniref:DUF4180 domain-containing protein n=1 Tax=Actinokineospora globicatena TaxID=103729 RepID=UPI0020A4FCC2|nr:DUF4180 domain-containing protein [Actinokineospora globicatena]MCP2304737.1 protein of unknown function (DUF4180) [Actinokineospora globicatena]GLW77887.1 hypothetical protein Aglo01_23690 [Actinokineospora globicatena]GLW85446.1 hypothetical protein Aglo02_30860 [Actinokineospora globicatena]